MLNSTIPKMRNIKSEILETQKKDIFSNELASVKLVFFISSTKNKYSDMNFRISLPINEKIRNLRQ
jgi:hypothetical protein